MEQVIIASVGSLNTDLVTTMPVFPCRGETVTGTSFGQFWGGKGANQCVAVARLSPTNDSVAMIGCVGSDAYGREYISALRAAGVETGCVEVVSGASGIATVLVDAKGENECIILAGANAAVSAATVSASLERFPCLRAVMVQLEIPDAASLTAMRIARSRDILAVLTPAPVPRSGLKEDMLRLADVLIPNAGEPLKKRWEGGVQEFGGQYFAFTSAFFTNRGGLGARPPVGQQR